MTDEITGAAPWRMEDLCGGPYLPLKTTKENEDPKDVGGKFFLVKRLVNLMI